MADQPDQSMAVEPDQSMAVEPDQPTYAGEFFDLSITSINNDYGALHNIGVMLYGINFPLKKFITELEMILKDEQGGASDDKAEKRQKRLDFLQYCNGLPQLQKFFERFCNYLNGKDGRGEQYSNFIVITAAGGNIIIVFAQLIMNIIDSYKKSDKDSDKKLDKDSLLPSNKILLEILLDIFKETYDDEDKNKNLDNIVKSIVLHFTINPDMLDVLKGIAKSSASDCDFKLSPNIFQSRDQESEFMVDQVISDISVLGVDGSQSSSQSGSQSGGTLDEDIRELFTMFSKLQIAAEKSQNIILTQDIILIIQLLQQAISNKVNAGFLLLRAKTLIDCRKYYKPPYTPKQLKKFKQSCLTKYKGLYPQTIQQIHLDEAAAELKKKKKDPKIDPCYIYLTHLMEKKKAIRTSTQMTTDQVIRFFVNGYFKQASKTGFMAPVVIPTENNTEAIIAYTRNITSNINIFIYTWFRVRMTPQGAPAKSSLQPRPYYYESLVRCFLSLDTIIINPSPIPLLAADIMNYFLNNPLFHTETILDELIYTFNTTRPKKCVMLPSDILLVPTEYQEHLSRIKEFLDSTLNSEYGYPDGLRITINAIITEKIKDIKEITSMLELDESEQLLTDYAKLDLPRSRSTIKKTHLPLSYAKIKKGGTKYYKKNTTFKNKLKNKLKNTKCKLKTCKKYFKKKSRKHKSRKHKL